MSDTTTLPGDIDAAIVILTPHLMGAMRAARTEHPDLPLAAFAGAAALALRRLALVDMMALQVRQDAGELMPAPPAALKLEMIGEFVLAMRGGGFL